MCPSLIALRADQLSSARWSVSHLPMNVCNYTTWVGLGHMHAANCTYCMQARQPGSSLNAHCTLCCKLSCPRGKRPWPGHLNEFACCNFAGIACLLQGQWEDRLASYFAHQIRTDPSPVYGEGFRAGLDAFQEHGLPAVLQAVASTGRLP